MLEKENVIFRQLCELNEKYTMMQDEAESNWMSLGWLECDQEEECIVKKNKFQQEQEAIGRKMKSLEVIAEKIKHLQLESHPISSPTLPSTITLIPQAVHLFRQLDSAYHFPNRHTNKEYLLFLEGLYDKRMLLKTKTTEA